MKKAMKRSISIFVYLLVACPFFLYSLSYATLVAESESDSYRIDIQSYDGKIRVYDTEAGFQYNWVLNSAVSDIVFDSVTGDLYAYAVSQTYKRALDGTVTRFNHSNSHGPAYNDGGDIAISYDGYVALSPADFYGDYRDRISVYDSYSNFMYHWQLDYAVSDIAFDSSGDLFAFTTMGIQKRSSTGVISNFLPDVHATKGDDITISSSGNIAISDNYFDDSINDTRGIVTVFNSTGSFLYDWNLEPVSDITYDQVTGDLYAYGYGSTYKRSTNGTVIMVSSERGPRERGDIAVFSSPSVIPEQLSFILFVVGGILLSGRKFLRR